MFHVVVPKPHLARARELRPAQHTGVRQFIEQDEVAALDKRRRYGEVGEVARAEQQRRGFLFAGGESRLQCLGQRMIAGDESRRRRPRAKPLHRRDGRRLHPRIVGEAEIVVAGKGRQATPPADDLRAPRALGGRHATAERLGLEVVQALLGKRIEAVHEHRLQACPRPTRRAPIDNPPLARNQGRMPYQTARDHLWRPYTQMKLGSPPLRAARTQGSRIVLADGRVLIDGVASWWTACHGYNHPHIREAMEHQLAAMPHIMFGGFTHDPAERLAERLATLLPGDLNHVFFSDSGSVAVEVAMKIAVQFHLNSGHAGRTCFLAFREGYHGDTMGAMSVCDPEESMHAHFEGWLPSQLFADLPRTPEAAAALDQLLAVRGGGIAAVIVEPLVQGAGGMRFHDAAALETIARLAKAHEVLLIADEIFTGFGRTGSMFACDQAGVVPDIMCVSKALTGGTMSLAATVATAAVFDAFWSDDPAKALMHGPTFMANPLACAAANASLDLFEAEPRVLQAAAMEAKLLRGLAPCGELPGVAQVRAKGAIGVVQLKAPADREVLKRAFVEQGVWVRPFGDIVYLTPALNIGDDDLGALTRAMTSVLGTAVG